MNPSGTMVEVLGRTHQRPGETSLSGLPVYLGTYLAHPVAILMRTIYFYRPTLVNMVVFNYQHVNNLLG